MKEKKAKQRRQTRIKSGGLFYEHGMKIGKKNCSNNNSSSKNILISF